MRWLVCSIVIGSVVAGVVFVDLAPTEMDTAAASSLAQTGGVSGPATIQPAAPLPGPKGRWTASQCDQVLSAFAANLSPLIIGAVRIGGQGPKQLEASYGSQYKYLRRQYRKIMGRPHGCRSLIGGPAILELDQMFIG